MRGIELIGLLAGFFMTIELVPQLAKTIKRKSAGDLAMQSLVLVGGGWNERGWHLGVLNPITGTTIKEAVRGRRIDV